MSRLQHPTYAAAAMARHRAGIKTMLLGLTERLDALEAMMGRIAAHIGPDQPPAPVPEPDQQKVVR
jgi:hypothetical protein